MRTNKQHTPTPWCMEERFAYPCTLRCETGSVAELKTTEYNAAFIVRAVNSHDELLACAKLLLQLDVECHARPDKMNGLLIEARERVLRAIARAEGRE